MDLTSFPAKPIERRSSAASILISSPALLAPVQFVWYDDTDEETFRPSKSDIPVAADEMYLVACEFTMADGSRHQGFGTPALEADEMGLIQPQIFSPSGKRYAFWLGMFPRQEEITGFYTDFAKGPSSVFPLVFTSLPGLTTAFCSGTV